MTNEELVLAYQDGNKKALDEVLKQNEKMVIKMVNKFYTDKTSAIDKEDLFQEGCIGLMIACKKYDFKNPTRTKFINYAVHWIYKKMHSFIHEQQTNEEISLSSKVDGTTELGETLIEDEDYFVTAEGCIYYQEVRMELSSAMDSELTMVGKNIIKLHYGWDGNAVKIHELAEIHGMKATDIQKIKRTALHKLRDSSWGRRERINRFRSY